MCKRSRLASVCKITQAWTASKTSAMGDEPAKRQIVRRFSQLMKSLPGFWSVVCTALKVRHHHRDCSEANILPGFLFLTSSSVIRGFHRLNSVLFHCQVSTGALNGDASPSAKIKSAAGDARAGKALALIRGVGVEGGAALPGSGLTDAPRRLLDGSVLKLCAGTGLSSIVSELHQRSYVTITTTTTWRALGSKGRKATASSRFCWRYQEGWNGATFRPTAASPQREWKLHESFFNKPPTLWVSCWAPGTATTAAQYQLLPLPAASLSWNQLHSWRAGWEAEKNTHPQPGGSSHLQHFHMQWLLQRFQRVFEWWAVNACSETPGNNASPNSQINRIHSLRGISFWMAGCCTSLSAFGRASSE